MGMCEWGYGTSHLLYLYSPQYALYALTGPMMMMMMMRARQAAQQRARTNVTLRALQYDIPEGSRTEFEGPVRPQ